MKTLSGSHSKGGGGSVRLPHEDANTLQSRAYARFVDLVCEGPIEGFCTKAGVTCRDVEFKSINRYVNTADGGSPTFRLIGGSLYFDPAIVPVEGDGVLSRALVGATSVPIVSESSGYPSSWADASQPIRCSIEGDGINAEVIIATYPKNTAEQSLTGLAILQLAHGFIVGQRVQKIGVFWQLTGASVPSGELRVVTAVADANNFTARLEVFPEGKVRGIKVNNTGKNYTWARINLPSTVLQAILFDEQPLANPTTLAPNFRDIRLEYRYGAEDQTVMPGFEQVEEVLTPDGAFEDTEIHYLAGRFNNNGLIVDLAFAPKSRLISGSYDRAIIDVNLFNGFYVQNVKNGDIESVGNPSATNLKDYNAFLTTYLDYTVTVRIEQRFKKLSDPGDLSTRAWIPFGRGLYVLAGKTMSPYVRSIEASLAKAEPNEAYQWEIRVTRLTFDDEDIRRSTLSEERRPFTKFKIDRITAVTNVKLTYPFSALVGIEINAEQFARMPVRSYQMKLMRVQVPTNYFPPFSVREIPNADGSVSRTLRQFAEYNRDGTTGKAVFDIAGNAVEQVWDGTFYESWTNNPAWIGYSICTDTRFGLGRYIQATSKWKHYQVGRYCDETVMTGYNAGSFDVPEPRFTAGVYVQAKEEAHRFLTDIASCFGGFYYYSGGAAIPIQERPRPVRMAFTVSDVENGLFEYRGTQRRVRHTNAYVKFNDPENNFKLTPVAYEDDEGVLRYGIQPIDKTYFSCISRGQARRHAKKIIRMETSNTDTVSFSTGIKAAVLQPGDVIAVYDPVRSTLPYGGRILGVNKTPAGLTSLTLDRWFDVGLTTPATAFQLVCSNPTKQIQEESVTNSDEAERLLLSQVVTLPISSLSQDSDKRRVVILAGAAPEGVVVGGVWGLQTATVEPQLFSVIGIDETDKHKYTVSALEYHDELFADIDADVPYSETSINPNLEGWKNPYPIRNLLLDVTTKVDQDTTVFTLNVSWSKPERGFGLEYEVWLQKGLGNYQFQTTTKNTHVSFRLTEADNYCVRIVTVGLQGRKSSAVQACIVIGSLEGTNKEIISGLEIKNSANSTIFSYADVEFDWRVNWSEATSQFHAEEVPVLPPGVSQYEIEFYNILNVKVGFYTTTESNFALTLDRNKKLTGGPYRDFIISVRARTTDGGISAATQLRVQNPAPLAPGSQPSADYTLAADTEGNVVITLKKRSGTITVAKTLVTSTAGDSFTGLSGDIVIAGVRYTIRSVTDATHLVLTTSAGDQTGVAWSSIPFPDFAGIVVWVSLTGGFVPNVSTAQVFLNDQVTIPLTLGQTNYIKWAYLDQIANNVLDCNQSAEYAITPNKEGRLSAFDFIKKR